MTEIREARPDDFSAAWPLLVAMGLTSDDHERVRSRFVELAADPDHLLVVADDRSGLLGYAWAQDYGPHLRSGARTARWNDLYVSEESRNLGTGRLLLEAVRSWAADRGVRWLQWQASGAAASFYEHLGLVGDPCPDPTHPFFEIEF